MPEELFVTVTGFGVVRDNAPVPIGTKLVCMKEPDNLHDDDAIHVTTTGGSHVGYLANKPDTKANGTLSSSRIYDRVGRAFLIEVMFTTRTKIICKVIDDDYSPA